MLGPSTGPLCCFRRCKDCPRADLVFIMLSRVPMPWKPFGESSFFAGYRRSLQLAALELMIPRARSFTFLLHLARYLHLEREEQMADLCGYALGPRSTSRFLAQPMVRIQSSRSQC